MNALEPSNLALFWAAVIAGSIVVYVVLDGFDLGVGILFGFSRQEDHREQMLRSIMPFWDGNETWLIVVAASLFGAFPVVYAVFLPAFYLPALLLLFGLIFRGVSFEFREHGHSRKLWEMGFFAGSVAVAFVQGAAVGAMIIGIPVTDGQYSGTSLEWLAPFPILCGIGLVVCYALLGAGWLVLKGQGDFQKWARAKVPKLALAAILILAAAFVVALLFRTTIVGGLAERRWGLVFPALALVSIVLAGRSSRWQGDHWPFLLTVLFILASFLTLAVMFWPYMIPYQVTVANAAAPEASLSFLFWGAVFVLPVIALYSVGIYWVFRGKVGTP